MKSTPKLSAYDKNNTTGFYMKLNVHTDKEKPWKTRANVSTFSRYFHFRLTGAQDQCISKEIKSAWLGGSCSCRIDLSVKFKKSLKSLRGVVCAFLATHKLMFHSKRRASRLPLSFIHHFTKHNRYPCAHRRCHNSWPYDRRWIHTPILASVGNNIYWNQLQ